MVTRSELAKIKKQASLVAQAKGENIDDIIATCLQNYTQDNFEWVLEAFSKQNSQKTNPHQMTSTQNQKNEIHTERGVE